MIPEINFLRYVSQRENNNKLNVKKFRECNKGGLLLGYGFQQNQMEA